MDILQFRQSLNSLITESIEVDTKPLLTEQLEKPQIKDNLRPHRNLVAHWEVEHGRLVCRWLINHEL
jgi:hypothetical protein